MTQLFPGSGPLDVEPAIASTTSAASRFDLRGRTLTKAERIRVTKIAVLKTSGHDPPRNHHPPRQLDR